MSNLSDKDGEELLAEIISKRGEINKLKSRIFYHREEARKLASKVSGLRRSVNVRVEHLSKIMKDNQEKRVIK